MQQQALRFGLATFVAGLALGAAALHFAAPRTTSTAPGAGPSAAPPAAAEGANAPGASPPAGTAPAPGSTAPSPASAPPPPSGVPAGREGVISGRVTGPDGKPLSGVLIRAWAVDRTDWEDDPRYAPDPPDGSPPALPDVERVTAHLRARLLRDQAGIRETVTDAAGAYALTGLTAPAYSVQAWLAGHRLERTAGGDRGDVVAVGGTCDFRSTRVGILRASVLLPDGTPAKKANISWTAPGGGGRSWGWEWTPAKSTIPVDHGTWEFTATASLERLTGPISVVREWWAGEERFLPDEGEPPYRSEPETATSGEGAPATLVLRLRGRPGIRVLVDFASPERPRSFRIAALRTDDPDGATPERLLDHEGPASTWVEGGAEGVLTGLEPGEHLVGVTFRGGLLGPTAVVDLGNDLATQEFRVAGEVRDWIKVRVLAPDGSTVTDAELEVGCRNSEGDGSQDSHPLALPDGSFRVEHFEWGAPGGSASISGHGFGSGPRTWWVRAKSERFGVVQATYDRARDREVTLAFAAPGVLKVSLTGFERSPDRERVRVRLEDDDEDGDSHVYVWGEIDRTGTAVFPPVNPGRYRVVLELSGEGKGAGRGRRSRDDSEVANVPVTVGVGETAIAIALPSLSNLSVSYESDEPGIEKVLASGDTHEPGARVSDSDRRTVRFVDLAPGRYRLVGDEGDMWVEVPASETIAFLPSPYNACRLMVRGEGYARELGLRTGDLVVAIDGAEFTDRLGMEAAFATAMTREASTLSIQRDGQRFDVAANMRRLDEDDASWHEPWSR